MAFASEIPHNSTALQGVKFIVHRIGFGRRTDIDLQTLAVRQRMRELQADYPPPSEQEKPLMEQLAIAEKKAFAVGKDGFDAVWKSDVIPLREELAAVIPADIARKRGLINLEYAAVDRMCQAEWIRGGLVSICDQREIKENVHGMTADQLIEYGPPELAQEIYAALIEDGRNRGEASKNLQSPTTSGAVADGGSKSSTAPDAADPKAVTT